MTVNSAIISALAPLGLPVVENLYTGPAEIYLTFNYDLLPALFADNRPVFRRALIQVHLFAPVDANTVALRGRTAALLESAGFGWCAVTDAGDGEGQHFVFETEAVLGAPHCFPNASISHEARL